MSEELDAYDRAILARLQRDCRQAVATLAQSVGLSKSACHRRMQLLEKRGVISGYEAVIDANAIGYRLHFIVNVRLGGQSDERMKAFELGVKKIPEVLECHLMTGDTDYSLRVVARDVEDYERIHHRLARLPGVSTLTSSLAVRSVMDGARVPLV